VERAYDVFRERIGHLDADRALAPDIEAAAALVREGVLVDL
jgi:histidine ammonia-lyase